MMGRLALLRYGLLGMPLAFLALPLYVHLPNLYARDFGVPLAVVGALLFGVRLADAVVDPLLGVLGERLFARSARRAWAAGAIAAAVLAAGFAAVFVPPAVGVPALVAFAAAALLVTYLAFSLLTVIHQAWGAKLGGGDVAQSRIVGWREGMALAGVLLASVLPTIAPRAAVAATLAALLAMGVWAWKGAPQPATHTGTPEPANWRLPLRDAGFRRLLVVFLLNGIASALPATLILFFVQDRLQAPAGMQPLFLGSYFAAAALSMPLWLRAVAAWGLARSWVAGMALAIAVFLAAATLGPGDAAAFLAICALSGLALGADLAVPAALLAAVVERAGARGRGETVYFGWWNFASKLNLAAAAGLALPLLALAGYSPGASSEPALRALTAAYCLLPCALKAAAAAALYVYFIQERP
jgi:GPH family glycoside/pentoside/hexuronide:cation symporter